MGGLCFALKRRETSGPAFLLVKYRIEKNHPLGVILFQAIYNMLKESMPSTHGSTIRRREGIFSGGDIILLFCNLKWNFELMRQ